jgi:hypothetical protein
MADFELENKLKSCKFFSFLEGMPIRIISKNKKALIYEINSNKEIIIFDDFALSKVEEKDIIPDLKNPGMLGYLLFLVRTAWEDFDMCTAPGPIEFGKEHAWCIFFVKDNKRPPIYRPSEIEAIISALEFREEISIYQ